jgi:Sulfotransferase family
LPQHRLHEIGEAKMENCPSVEDLMAMASSRTGLSDFGPAERQTALNAFVTSLCRETWPGMTAQARSLALDYIVHLLCNRIRLMAERHRYPQIEQETIRRPIVVVGPPRSGSTLLHKFLSLDEDHLSPEHSLCMEPCPAPALGALTKERLTAAEQRLMGLFNTIPDIFVTHPYIIEEGAGALAECGSNILNMVFTAQQLWCFYRGESYRHYLLEANHSAALHFHREFLQHLQWGTTGKRWALKGSDHMLWLEELAQEYPDALLVWTHRDLAQQLGSLASIQTILFGLTGHAVSDVERNSVGRLTIEHQRASLAKGMRARQKIGEHRFFDVSYHDMMASPVRTVERIYQHFGLEMKQSHARAITAWLADNPATKHGQHQYSSEAFGLEAQSINRQFKDYVDRFGFGFGIRPALTQ